MIATRLSLLVLIFVTINSCGTATDPHAQNTYLPEELDARVQEKSDIIRLNTSRSGQPNGGGSLIGGDPVQFEYMAALQSPLHPQLNIPMQATSIKQLDATHIAVVYNIAGEELGGALEVVNVANSKAPKILSVITFTDREFSDLAWVSPSLFLLSGNNAEGAMVQAIKAENKFKKLTLLNQLPLPGYTATSIHLNSIQDVVEPKLIVTTANQGGVYEIKVKQDQTLEIVSGDSLDRASYAQTFQGSVLALGEQGASNFFTKSPSGLIPSGLLPQALLDAPARFTFTKNFNDPTQNLLITNASDHTGSIYSIQNSPLGFVLNEVSHLQLPGRGNSVASLSHVSLYAQGDAGLVWVNQSQPESPKIEGTFEFPNDTGSTNQVLIMKPSAVGKDQYVFMASGLQGLRWIKEIRRKKFSSTLVVQPGQVTQLYKDFRLILGEHQVKIPNTVKVQSSDARNVVVTLKVDQLECEYSSVIKISSTLTRTSCNEVIPPSRTVFAKSKIELLIKLSNQAPQSLNETITSSASL